VREDLVELGLDREWALDQVRWRGGQWTLIGVDDDDDDME